MCIEDIMDIFKGLLTPTIAIITTFIAFQQLKTNRQKLNLDKYERRLLIYQEVMRILSIILRDAHANYEDLLKFRTSVSEADFLFGTEVIEYINNIYEHGIKLESWNRQYRDSAQPKPEGYDHKKIVDGMHEELLWLTHQFEPAKKIFIKYLNIK